MVFSCLVMKGFHSRRRTLEVRPGTEPFNLFHLKCQRFFFFFWCFFYLEFKFKGNAVIAIIKMNCVPVSIKPKTNRVYVAVILTNDRFDLNMANRAGQASITKSSFRRHDNEKLNFI